jgi:hypothetical protein
LKLIFPAQWGRIQKGDYAREKKTDTNLPLTMCRQWRTGLPDGIFLTKKKQFG